MGKHTLNLRSQSDPVGQNTADYADIDRLCTRPDTSCTELEALECVLLQITCLPYFQPPSILSSSEPMVVSGESQTYLFYDCIHLL